jgi:hypothetical protein
MVILYHYTDALDDILEDGELIASSGGAYGVGVYFTSMAPLEGFKAVVSNNWGGGRGVFENIEGNGKMEGVVQIHGDDARFANVGKIHGRDVFLFRQSRLKLEDFKHAAFSLEWRGDTLLKLSRVDVKTSAARSSGKRAEGAGIAHLTAVLGRVSLGEGGGGRGGGGGGGAGGVGRGGGGAGGSAGGGGRGGGGAGGGGSSGGTTCGDFGGRTKTGEPCKLPKGSGRSGLCRHHA